MNRDEAPAFRPLVIVLIFLVAVLAAYIYNASRVPGDPDQFWHVATGRYIVEHRAIPHTDVFSWWGIENHRPWAAQEWLFGLLAFGLYSVGGWKGLYLFTALLEGLLVLIVYALTRARGVNPMWSLLIMTVTIFGTLPYTTARPQVVTFCLVALTALLLQRGKWPWALLVVLIGVNLHGGVWPLYVLVFALYEFPKRWWLPLAAVAVTLLNPNTVAVFLLPFQAMLSPGISRIQEFTPTALWTQKGDLVMYVALLLAVQRRHIKFRDGLFALAFVLLSLSAIRHVQWFYILVLPIMAPYIVVEHLELDRLREALAKIPVLRRLKALSPSQGVDAPGLMVGAGADEPTAEPATVAERSAGRSRIPELVLIGALSLTAIYLGGRAWRQQVDPERDYPRDLVAYIKVNKLERMLNVWHEGGYLIYKGIPPMIDGRGDPFGPQYPGDVDFTAEYMALNSVEISPRSFMLRHKIEYLLMRRSQLLIAMMNDPAFKSVRQGESHILLRFDADIARSTTQSSGSVGPTSASGTVKPGVTIPDALRQSGSASATPTTQAPSP